jgi:Ulp1 family protease
LFYEGQIILQYQYIGSNGILTSIVINQLDITNLSIRGIEDKVIDFYLQWYIHEKHWSLESCINVISPQVSRSFLQLDFDNCDYSSDETHALMGGVSFPKQEVSDSSHVYMIPIHDVNHWSLFILVDVVGTSGLKRVALHYDSLPGIHDVSKITRGVKEYLKYIGDSTYDREWKYRAISIPKQRDSYDCGLYVQLYASSFLKTLNQIGGLEELTTEDLNELVGFTERPDEKTLQSGRDVLRRCILHKAMMVIISKSVRETIRNRKRPRIDASYKK